jgi:hypothetical protein
VILREEADVQHDDEPTLTAFAGTRRLHRGPRAEVLRAVKAHVDGAEPEAEPVLVFDDETGRQVDFDLRGTMDEVLARAAPRRRPAGPGRPKLGVVAREVTLLPRHWQWLERQRGGASAALRRLVEEARRSEPDRARARRALEAAGTFLWTMAGDLPGFEEASRALYARDGARLRALSARWPRDVRDHGLALFEAALRLEPAEPDAPKGARS